MAVLHNMLLSSTVPVFVANVYASEHFSTIAYPGNNIVGLLLSNQAGTLAIEQSNDHTNWDLSETVAIVAGVAREFVADVVASYCRVKFTHGGAAPTVWRLGVYMRAGG